MTLHFYNALIFYEEGKIQDLNEMKRALTFLSKPSHHFLCKISKIPFLLPCILSVFLCLNIFFLVEPLKKTIWYSSNVLNDQKLLFKFVIHFVEWGYFNQRVALNISILSNFSIISHLSASFHSKVCTLLFFCFHIFFGTFIFEKNLFS